MKKRYFTEQEAREAIWDCEIERKYGENRRWSRSARSIVSIDEKYYAINWEQGLTEGQDNEYYADDYPEVEKVTYEKTITVTEWKPIE